MSASVRQAWLVANDDARDVIIGVALEGPAELRSHAWLSGEDEQGEGYVEIARVAPRSAE